MDDPAPGGKTHLSWANVGLAFLFVAFDAGVSRSLGLEIGLPLLTAAVRCVVQLTLMSLVLAKVFEAHNPWGVAGLASMFFLGPISTNYEYDAHFTVLLNLLGAIEVSKCVFKMISVICRF